MYVSIFIICCPISSGNKLCPLFLNNLKEPLSAQSRRRLFVDNLSFSCYTDISETEGGIGLLKRLGLMIPGIVDPLDFELLNGIYDAAKKLKYDVLIYTGIYNSNIDLQQDSYIRGLENIYTLPAKQRLNGILFAAERFHNQPVREQIRQQLMQTNTPVLVMGEDLLPFESIHPRQQDSIYRITKHLIEAHGCKTIYCISGFNGNQASEERIAGYRQAMQEAGLSCRNDWIFYGEFWQTVPAEIGRQIASGSIPMPDAVVCASDVMASALCESLMQNGIAVPGQVRITGYDGGWDSWLNIPRITTVEGRERQFGEDAVFALHEMITGESAGFSTVRQTVRYGESCGCNPAQMPQNPCSPVESYLRANIRNHMQKYTFLASDLFAQTGGAVTLNDWITKVDRTGHVLQNWHWLDICLCKDWCMEFSYPDRFRQIGFDDRMLLALSKRPGKNAPDQYEFDTRDILPALSETHEPMLILVTSLHAHGQIFGYLASAYTKPEDMEPDEYYTNWCDAAAHGLYQLQQAMYAEYRRRQIPVISSHDAETGLYNRRGFAEHLHEVLHRRLADSETPLLIMLGIAGDSNSVPECNPVLLLGNALRDVLPENGFLARMQPNVYALIVPADQAESDSEFTGMLAASAEHRMQHLLGTADVRIPRIISAEERLLQNSLAEAAASAEELEQTLLDRIAAAAVFAADYREILQKLRSEITLNPQKEWDIEQEAKKIGISRSHLQRLYKQYFSVSCMDDVISARMNKAKSLLKHTDLRIQEIAIQCGYQNVSHFMRQFKEKSGMTAMQYRKNNL